MKIFSFKKLDLSSAYTIRNGFLLISNTPRPDGTTVEIYNLLIPQDNHCGLGTPISITIKDKRYSHIYSTGGNFNGLLDPEKNKDLIEISPLKEIDKKFIPNTERIPLKGGKNTVIIGNTLEASIIGDSIFDNFPYIVTHIIKEERAESEEYYLKDTSDKYLLYRKSQGGLYSPDMGSNVAPSVFSKKPNDIFSNQLNYSFVLLNKIIKGKEDSIVKLYPQSCMDPVKVNQTDTVFDIYFNQQKCGYSDTFIKEYVEAINSLGFSKLEVIGEVTMDLSFIEKYTIITNNAGHLLQNDLYCVRLYTKTAYSNYVSTILLRYLFWDLFQKLPKIIMEAYKAVEPTPENFWRIVLETNKKNRVKNTSWNIVDTSSEFNEKTPLNEYRTKVNSYVKNKAFTNLLCG